jgi:hypothetical protein
MDASVPRSGVGAIFRPAALSQSSCNRPRYLMASPEADWMAFDALPSSFSISVNVGESTADFLSECNILLEEILTFDVHPFEQGLQHFQITRCSLRSSKPKSRVSNSRKSWRDAAARAGTVAAFTSLFLVKEGARRCGKTFQQRL